MDVKSFAFAAALAVAPAAAGAVTYDGSFNPGGVFDGTHDIDAGGFQGDSIIRATSGDAGAPFNQTWTFTAIEDLIVGGEGTVRRGANLEDLSITFDGMMVMLVSGAADTLTFAFPDVAAMMGEAVQVTVAWSDYIGGATSSSTVTFDIFTSEPAPIPLPTAGWLLLGALGSLTLMRSRSLRDV